MLTVTKFYFFFTCLANVESLLNARYELFRIKCALFCHLSQHLLSIKINVLCFHICDGYVEWRTMISLSHSVLAKLCTSLLLILCLFFFLKSQIKKKIGIGLGGNIEEEGEKDGGSC